MRDNLRDLLIALLAVALTATVVLAVPEIAIRRAGRIILVANTPQVLGTAAGRVELQLKNEGANDICCGQTPAALNCGTPGANAGFRYKSGEGIIRCVFPDIPYYCVDSVGGSEVSVEEAFLLAGTPTATP